MLEDKIAKELGFEVKSCSPIRSLYYYNKKNDKGQSLVVELSACYDTGGDKSNAAVWYKNGYTKTRLKHWLDIDCQVTTSDGVCILDYNPQTKHTADLRRLVIDFDWVLPRTEENAEKLLKEVVRRFEQSVASKVEDKYIKKYNEVSNEYPDAFVLLRDNGGYACINEDADVAFDILLEKERSVGNYRCVWFAADKLDSYLPKLVRAGKRITIFDV